MLKKVLALVISAIMAASLLTACIGGGGGGNAGGGDKGSNSNTISENTSDSAEIPSDASSAASDKGTNGENTGTGGGTSGGGTSGGGTSGGGTSGAKGAVTIDISTLGGADADNKAKTTESQWQYVDNKNDEPQNSKALYLTSPDGNYTLKGTNTALRIQVATTATNAKVTLNGIAVVAPPKVLAFGIAANCTVTLVGNNVFTAEQRFCMNVAASKNCVITGNGFLELTSNDYYTLVLRKDALLSIEGDAHLEAKNTFDKTKYAATWCEGNNKIKVGKNCSLISRGCGTGIISKGDFNLTCDGVVTIASYYYQGLNMSPAENAGNTLIIDGSGKLDALGTDECSAILSTGAIKIGDGLTMHIGNSATKAKAYTFEALNASSTSQWKVTDGKVTGSLTDKKITVSIEPSALCTIERPSK